MLVAHGLDLETVRAEVDRLIDQGVLPGPQPSDGELLATLGIDLEAVHARLQESFGDQAHWEAAQQVRRGPTQPVAHTPHVRTDPPPLLCGRAVGLAAHEAIARDQEVGPEHLLLGLLQEAEDPVETELPPQDRRQRAVLGLPDHGPNPIRLLVEARGLTLQARRGHRHRRGPAARRAAGRPKPTWSWASTWPSRWWSAPGGGAARGSGGCCIPAGGWPWRSLAPTWDQRWSWRGQLLARLAPPLEPLGRRFDQASPRQALEEIGFRMVVSRSSALHWRPEVVSALAAR